MKTAATVLAATLVAAAPSVATATNVAFGKPVTGTPFYDNGSETFTYQNLTDGRLDDTGTGGNWSFWLTPNGTLGSATIDLLGLYDISTITLQNTHNRGYGDRATRDFRIELSADGTSFSTLLASTLPYEGGTLSLHDYAADDAVARYVRVDVDSFYGSSGGLNEVMVNAVPAVPEPAAAALPATLAGGAILVRRRRA